MGKKFGQKVRAKSCSPIRFHHRMRLVMSSSCSIFLFISLIRPRLIRPHLVASSPRLVTSHPHQTSPRRNLASPLDPSSFRCFTRKCHGEIVGIPQKQNGISSWTPKTKTDSVTTPQKKSKARYEKTASRREPSKQKPIPLHKKPIHKSTLKTKTDSVKQKHVNKKKCHGGKVHTPIRIPHTTYSSLLITLSTRPHT
jgi:hypothetical protein